MPALKFQYSIRTMLLLTAVTALGLSSMMRPTMRAHQFAQAIRSGRYDTARNMVPDAFGTRDTGFFSSSSEASIEPLSALQLWNGTRTVIVDDLVNYRRATFTITRNSDSSSAVFPVGDRLFIRLKSLDEHFGAGGFDPFEVGP